MRSFSMVVQAMVIVTACARPAEREILPLPAPEMIDSPAGPGSGEPFLSPAADGVWLSWLEAVDSAYEFRVSLRSGDAWSPPRTVARSASFFVNWADFPSILELPDGRIAAHWLGRSGAGRYAYDVVVALSRDDGATWSDEVRPHADGTQTEHGFATLFVMPDGEMGAVWLDGRETAGNAHDGSEHSMNSAMTLRYTTFSAAGVPAADELVDGRTCDCCQTDVAVTADGPVLVYRDRSDTEVRDIAVTRHVNGSWTEPVPVHEDGWVIPGCPVNGPSAAARERELVVAWFTAAQDTARVRVAFSSDAGATFGAPLRIDDGDPVGRADVLMLDDGQALVSWLERTDDGAEVRVRLVAPDGAMGSSTTVAASSAERASGFPRMALAGDRIVFAWTEPEPDARVRVAEMPLPRFRAHQEQTGGPAGSSTHDDNSS
ncbi:MAG: sialidase family protein [Longimicrobiales bacterium]